MHKSLRQPKMRRPIRSIDTANYATSKERIADLRVLTELGEQAETIKKFVDAWLDDTEERLLAELLTVDSNAEQIKYQYQAAISFADKITDTIATGKQKEETLKKLLRSR